MSRPGESPNGLHRRSVQADASAQAQRSPNAPAAPDPAHSEGQQAQTTLGQQPECRIKPVNSEDAWLMPMVLSLDAGGVRGFWSLLVLEKLMCHAALIERRLNPENRSSFEPCHYQEHTTHLQYSDDSHASRYLPCHYFDLIVGSSTGALSAIMLGRLRMTVNDCLDEYRKLAGRIFANPKATFGGMIPIFGGVKYEGEGAAETFEALCARRAALSSHCDNVLFKTPKGACRICVATSSIECDKEGQPMEEFLPLRSYGLRQHLSDKWASNALFAELTRICGDLQLWKVARATIAASYIFREVPIRLRTGDVYLSDGGMMHYNSPVRLALEEARSMCREYDYSDIGILVSIGTAKRDLAGSSSPARDGKRKRKRMAKRRNVLNMAKLWATQVADPEFFNEFIIDNFQTPDPKFPFFRFNNPHDATHPAIAMDEWKPKKLSTRDEIPGHETMEKIRKNFTDWYGRDGVRDMFESCAERLVRVRRLRTEHRSKWERHAEVSSYTCHEDACGDPKFKYRHQFEIHMDRHHQIRGDALEAKLEEGRELWEYVSKDGASNWH